MAVVASLGKPSLSLPLHPHESSFICIDVHQELDTEGLLGYLESIMACAKRVPPSGNLPVAEFCQRWLPYITPHPFIVGSTLQMGHCVPLYEAVERALCSSLLPHIHQKYRRALPSDLRKCCADQWQSQHAAMQATQILQRIIVRWLRTEGMCIDSMDHMCCEMRQ